MTFIVSCRNEQLSETTSETLQPSEVYVTTIVNDMELTLRNENGRCVLAYKPKRQYGPQGFGQNTVHLDMEAPCNFIRVSNVLDEPRTYSPIKNDPFKRKIMLIVGGSPDPEFPPPSDRFMPNGCGSWMQKITVFEHIVRVDFPAFSGPNRCPTSGADEVEFAT